MRGTIISMICTILIGSAVICGTMAFLTSVGMFGPRSEEEKSKWHDDYIKKWFPPGSNKLVELGNEWYTFEDDHGRTFMFRSPSLLGRPQDIIELSPETTK